MKRKGMFASVLFAAILVLGACGGADEGADDNNENGGAEMENGNNEGAPEGGEATSSLDVTATNWKFNKDTFTLQSGEPVTINFQSEEGVHGFGIKGKDEINIQKSGTSEVTLKPGEYEVYCTVPCGEGHANMKSTLVVE